GRTVNRPDFMVSVKAIAEQIRLCGSLGGNGISTRRVSGGARLQRHLIIVIFPAPAKMHAVEIQDHPRQRRIIGEMIFLWRRDLFDPRQGASPDRESLGRCNPGLSQVTRKTGQIVTGKNRISASGQYQHTIRAQYASAKPMRCAQTVKRIKRGYGLERTGRRNGYRALVFLKHLSGSRIKKRITDPPRQVCGCDNRPAIRLRLDGWPCGKPLPRDRFDLNVLRKGALRRQSKSNGTLKQLAS